MDYNYGARVEAERRRREEEEMERERKRKERNENRNGKILIFILSFLILFLIGSNGFYTVTETQQAVVTRFGAYLKTEFAGPHFCFPFVDSVKKVSTANRAMIIGYNPENNENILEESKMITGDVNIANVDFYVTWRVSEAYKFLFNSNDPETILKNIIQSSARSVIGSQAIDNVLTSGKSQIQADIKERVFKALEKYDLGITLVELIIQDAEPADNAGGDVIKAFKDVETAMQNQESEENQGHIYANEQVPLAEAKADKIVKSAEAEKEARIAQANGEVAEFVAMYKEYSKNPEIVKERMYWEMVESVYPDLQLYIDTSSTENGSNILKLLPLEASNVNE